VDVNSEGEEVNNFATILRRFRDASGLTQQQLAKAVGISRPYLARLETVHCNPTWRLVCRLAKALGVDVGEFGK
jgi:transcriptional regulator with XRE-family HTH domain